MEHWINGTNGKDAFDNLIDEKQYYCYDKMKWDACQMNEKNYHLWFDQETRMKSCQINKNTIEFLKTSKLSFEEGGSKCFDTKNVRVENQDMCDCLNPKFGNKASWDQYNKFKSQIDKNNWPTDVANEASYQNHWLHGVISTFKSNGESISDENVEKRNNLFKAMHKQYCIQEFKQLAKETENFEILGGKPIYFFENSQKSILELRI